MQADKKKIINRLSRARGQINGIIKMVEEDRYCVDISTQLLAASKALDSINMEVLTEHMKGCVMDSFESEDENAKQEKIEEILTLIKQVQRI